MSNTIQGKYTITKLNTYLINEFNNGLKFNKIKFNKTIK